ncbi:hypothetical protein MRX96_011350 [Rhipicephalus microplus]
MRTYIVAAQRRQGIPLRLAAHCSCGVMCEGSSERVTGLTSFIRVSALVAANWALSARHGSPGHHFRRGCWLSKKRSGHGESPMTTPRQGSPPRWTGETPVTDTRPR